MKFLSLLFLTLIVFCFTVKAQEAPTESKKPNLTGTVLNGKAISLPQPEYPPEAAARRATGIVRIKVTIDEKGNIVDASYDDGIDDPALVSAAVKAAYLAKFNPTTLSGQPVKVSGIISYNFTRSEPNKNKDLIAVPLVLKMLSSFSDQDELFKAMLSDLDFADLEAVEINSELKERVSVIVLGLSDLSDLSLEQRRSKVEKAKVQIRALLKGDEVIYWNLGEILGEVFAKVLTLDLESQASQQDIPEARFADIKRSLTLLNNELPKLDKKLNPTQIESLKKISAFATRDDLAKDETFDDLFESLDGFIVSMMQSD